MRYRYYQYYIYNRPNRYDEIPGTQPTLKHLMVGGYECLPGVYFFIHDSSRNLVHLAITEQSPWYNALIYLPLQFIRVNKNNKRQHWTYTSMMLGKVINQAVKHNAKKNI